jgi:hypothetical protein
VLALAHGTELRDLTADSEKSHSWVPEPERSKALQLGAEVERELRAADDGFHVHDGREIIFGQFPGRAGGERLRESLDVLGSDGEARGCAGAPPQRPSRSEQAPSAPVQVEGGNRTPGTRPLLIPPAMRTTGRWKRSTNRDATMPITPRCQSSPART